MLRFEKGTKACQRCGTFDDVKQIVIEKEIKMLPVQELRFLCKGCVVKIVGEK